ncbi:hypothetical protein Bca52824_072283 [Brassica carinata]|uniref:Uncharacterized protein n=1 Tax=Brassica carinata TaxID=52824 RepID=A0A8X7Q7N1_BRACI|nr:hypothetical protein Bca52824_072283 [Brassica carinata]
MQITVAALIGHPLEYDIIFCWRQRKSATKLYHENQSKPLKTINLEPWIYASESSSTICDRSKKTTWILRSRVDWARGDHKHGSETNSRTTRRESRRKNSDVRDTASHERKPTKLMQSEQLFPGDVSWQQRCRRNHCFPESDSITGYGVERSPVEVSSHPFLCVGFRRGNIAEGERNSKE